MDVVNSEVKQLGGSIDIQSVKHQGTQFSIYLPFTVSVNRALMISMGEERYAIPLSAMKVLLVFLLVSLKLLRKPDSRFVMQITAINYNILAAY